MRRVAPAGATTWLGDAASALPGGGYTGFDVDVWDARTWVLNTMYESEVPLPDMSWDELLKAAPSCWRSEATNRQWSKSGRADG